jgi:hypothetical protein
MGWRHRKTYHIGKFLNLNASGRGFGSSVGCGCLGRLGLIGLGLLGLMVIAAIVGPRRPPEPRPLASRPTPRYSPQDRQRLPIRGIRRTNRLRGRVPTSYHVSLRG